MDALVHELTARIRDAAASGTALRVRGGGTKDFYGGVLQGEVLDLRQCSGIVDYEPTELVITARAGTLLAELEAAMHERGQMLAFEPPRFDVAPNGLSRATLGGAIASGLSGPRRPYAGSARDLVLGVRIIDGSGNDLRFGGQVMKNVAGYDVSRLMAGSMGTLGVLLEVTLKALPRAPAETTLRFELGADTAIERMNAWAGQALPLSGTCHIDGAMYVRLSGAESAVRAARAKLGGEVVADTTFWDTVRDHTHPWFHGQQPLWRLSIKPTTPSLALGATLLEWNGALRWMHSDAAPEQVREAAARAGGHATLFSGGDKAGGVFQPLSPALMSVHRRLKRSFDPRNILNRGRLYPEL